MCAQQDSGTLNPKQGEEAALESQEGLFSCLLLGTQNSGRKPCGKVASQGKPRESAVVPPCFTQEHCNSVQFCCVPLNGRLTSLPPFSNVFFLSQWILSKVFFKNPPKGFSLIQHTLVVYYIAHPPRHQSRHGASMIGQGMHYVFVNLSLIFGYPTVLLLSLPCFLPVHCRLPFRSLHDAALHPNASLSIAQEGTGRPRQNM